MTHQPPAWAEAGTPVGAHAIAEHHLQPAAYARTRGVSQPAARLAGTRVLGRDARALLLCAASLHEAGGRRLDARLRTARALREAGHECLACLVAHHRLGALEATLRGAPRVEDEFAIPDGPDEDLLVMLDAAVVTTDAAGAQASPAAALRALTDEVGAADPEVRAMVALIDRLGDDARGRALVEAVAWIAPRG